MHLPFIRRTTGQYPLSIATSLALESATGIHPDIIALEPPIIRYKLFYVNIRTLFRNFMGAVETGGFSSSHPADMAVLLIEEMEQIIQIVNTYATQEIKVVFYLSEYNDLELKYSYSFIRAITTEKQRETQSYADEVYKLIIKHCGIAAPEGIYIKTFRLKLEAESYSDCLILTHYAFDLVSYPLFSKLMLLESHTGHLKDRSLWYTKYYQGKELIRIPFREDLLQIFGDNELFRPFPSNNRKEIIAIAEKYNWTATTTKAKISMDLKNVKDPFFKTIISKIVG